MSGIKRSFISIFLSKLYSRFWVQIALVLFVTISIAILLLGAFFVNNSQSAVRNSVLNNHKDIVAQSAREIDLFLKRPEDILYSAASTLSAMPMDPWHQETMLVGLALEHPVFIRVSHFGLSGRQIAGSDLGRSPDYHIEEGAIGKIIGEEAYISAVRFQEDNHMPYLTIAVPVKEKGKISGFLVADINLRGLWDIVDKISLGSTGKGFLVSSDGRLLASPDKKDILKGESFTLDKDVAAVLSGRNEAVEIWDGAGKRWVSSYAPISGTGWGIVLRQEQDEAYFFSKMMRIQAWVIIILSEIIAAILAVVMARVLAHPLKNLLRRVKSTAGPGIANRINTKRHDEIGELIRAFNDLNDKLKDAEATKRFSTIGKDTVWVAHELKNSLAPIKSFVQMLSKKHRDGKFIDRFSSVVSEEIGRCERMFKGLSDFLSPFELKMERVNIKDIMDEALKIMEDRLAIGSTGVEYLLKNRNLYIRGDAERIKQVFLNLLINAVEAMPDGGMLNIGMELINESYPHTPARVKVTISDCGRGIPPDRLKVLFEPFKSTKKDGMGLGLFISRRILEQHGAAIDVESAAGEGTSFTVIFPAQEPSQKDQSLNISDKL